MPSSAIHLGAENPIEKDFGLTDVIYENAQRDKNFIRWVLQIKPIDVHQKILLEEIWEKAEQLGIKYV